MRKSRNLIAGLVGAVVCAVCITGCASSSSTGSAQIGDTLSLASLTPENTFDPAKMNCGSEHLYCQAVYDALLHLDADQNPIPGMATSFQYDATRTKLTLQLRPGIIFSDGSAFNAAAAKANLDRFMAVGGQNANMATSIKSVKVEGPMTLQIVLSAPDPALLSNLASNLGMMASPAALKSGNLTESPVGSGPYVYDAGASQSGTSVFTRNKSYWDAKAFPFDTVKVVALADPNTILDGLQVGQLDAAPIGAAQIKTVKADGMSVSTVANGWDGLILADRAGSVQPALGKLAVRQAINLALDRNLFSKTLVPGNPKETDQIFAPAGPAYVESLNAMYSQNITKAKSLMAQAGYANGFSVTMPDLSAFVGSPALNIAMDQELGAIGIKVTWAQVPALQLLSSMESGKYPMFFMSLATKTPWQDLQLSVMPSAAWNPFHASEPTLDRLISAAQHAAQGNAQNAAFQAVNTWLVSNAWFAPIIAPTTAWAAIPGVKIEPQSQGVDLVRFQRAN